MDGDKYFPVHNGFSEKSPTFIFKFWYMKNLYLTLAGIFIFILTGTAQEIQWQNTIGGSSNDYLYSIQQTSEGSYIFGGFSWSNFSGDKTENCI
jgi:hypothetical protein